MVPRWWSPGAARTGAAVDRPPQDSSLLDRDRVAEVVLEHEGAVGDQGGWQGGTGLRVQVGEGGADLGAQRRAVGLGAGHGRREEGGEVDVDGRQLGAEEITVAGGAGG